MEITQNTQSAGWTNRKLGSSLGIVWLSKDEILATDISFKDAVARFPQYNLFKSNSGVAASSIRRQVEDSPYPYKGDLSDDTYGDSFRPITR